jgi:hypothetical protein
LPNFVPADVFISGPHQTVRTFRAQLADEIDSRGDVAPLIAAAHLQSAAVPVEQLQEVVRLQHEIAELGVRNAIFAFETTAHRFFLQHVVDGEMLAGVAEKRDEIDRRQPVGVVDDARGVLAWRKIQKPLELHAHGRDIRVDLLGREQHALLRLAARIADHARAAADNRDRRVTESLQAREADQREQIPDMEARRGRIKADVGGDGFLREDFRQSLGGVVHHAAPLEFIEDVHGTLTISVDGNHAARRPEGLRGRDSGRGRWRRCVRIFR